MKVDKTPVTVMILLVAAAAAQLYHYYPRLPATIAVHFGAAGRPDGWSDKASFYIIYAAIEAAVAFTGVALAFLGDRIPTSFLNVPKKDYWLSPDRREESLSFFWTQTIWIEVMTLGFLIAIAELVFRANLSDAAPRLTSDAAVVIVVFVAAVVWQSVRIVRRFSRTEP